MAFITDLEQWGVATVKTAAVSAVQFAAGELFEELGNEFTEESGIVVQDIPQGIGQLGSPVYSSLVFFLEPGEAPTASTAFVTGLLYYPDVIMTVNQRKHMSETKVSGRQDTVKEFISNGEYDIDIQIRVTSRFPRVLPANQIREVFAILSAERSVRVASRFLNFFSITNIVIKSWSMPQKAGNVNNQVIKIKAVSNSEDTIFQGITTKSRV